MFLLPSLSNENENKFKLICKDLKEKIKELKIINC